MRFKTLSSEFGKNLHVRIWGGSHEPYVGADIWGFPKDFELDCDKIKKFMERRATNSLKPGSSSRSEADCIIFTAGIDRNITKDGKISLKIKNTNAITKPYTTLKYKPRPGHADFPAFIKYGNSVNLSGGGPFSARLTAPLCAAGAMAIQYLDTKGIKIVSRIYSIADICDEEIDICNPDLSKFEDTYCNEVPCINKEQSKAMVKAIKEAKKEKDSLGAVVEAFICGLPLGVGAPMYQGIESVLSNIIFGIPAVKAIAFGSGTDASKMKGSTHNDSFTFENGNVVTKTNNHGGILGGISTGMPIRCLVYFKPTPSIGIEQQTVNLKTKEKCTIKIQGRHDTCVGIRALPIVEAALALGISDIILGEEKERELAKIPSKNSIENLREYIDFLDTKIADLLLQRYELISKIGSIKKVEALPILDKNREEQIKARVREIILDKNGNSGSGSSQTENYIINIFENIMKASRDAEKVFK